VKPCNYLSLTRQHQSIKGLFIIDPTLHIPEYLLPLLNDRKSEGDRKNMKLLSENGSVNADIYLVDGRHEETAKTVSWTSLYVQSNNSWVVINLVHPHSHSWN
jgi:hypothetical protein